MNLRERKRKVLNPDDFNENVQPVKKARGRAPGRPKGSPNKKRTNPAGSAESEILAALRNGQNIHTLIDNWIKEYEENVDLAIVKILQFFISATGCKGAVSAVMVKSMEFKTIIANLSEEFDEDTNDYPLTMTGAQWKKFRTLFGNFIMIFVSKIKSSIIFDDGFTDFILQLLTGLADSQIRAFRHTATFAAMKFSSAMVDLVVELVELKEKNNKQIETEKTKLKQRNTNERLDALLGVKTDLETKIQELCLMIQFVFKSVFAHRYRDTVPDVRCICIEELGYWMAAYPVLFLEDSYLKYVGWSLFDKVCEVRMKCVSVLLPLYERQDLNRRLELFTSKFKDRLVSMVTDRDIDVAVKSCHLITQIHCAFPTMLQLKDCVPIYETVYCTNRALAVAAGNFLNARVFQTVDERGNPVDKRILIQNLVAFFIEGEVHNHPAYLVDALIDNNPIIKDFATMAEMLLSDEANEADDQLIEIMVCSVKQAATGEPPVGRQSTKKTGAPTTVTRDPRAIHEERTRITEAFIPTLPRLINKFIADQEKINSLTQLPLFFELEIYQVGRHERQLTDLMEAFGRVFDQHSEDEILKNLVSVMNHFASSNSVAQLTETSRTQIIDRISLQFRQNAQQALNDEQLDEEDEAGVLAGFRKLSALSIVFEIRNVEVWDTAIRILQNTSRFHTQDIIEKGVQLLFYTLTRDIKSAADGKETKASIGKMKKRRDEFMQQVRTILDHSANVEQAFFCLCDVLILCNWKLKDDNERLNELVVSLDAPYIESISRFVVQNVFEVSQEQFEKLDQQSQIELTCKRRVVLGQYCKLIMYGILPIVDISLVLRYYLRNYADYGDMMKQMLSRCRDMNRLAMAQAMIRALKDVYEGIKGGTDDGYVDPVSDEFSELRDLAKRFAGHFTADQGKNREAVALIHQLGIRFALGLEVPAPQRRRRATAAEETQSLSFLEVLQEFSPKLLKHDKAAVLKYLIDHSNPPHDCAENEQWQPFLLYKNSLSPVTNRAAAMNN